MAQQIEQQMSEILQQEEHKQESAKTLTLSTGDVKHKESIEITYNANGTQLSTKNENQMNDDDLEAKPFDEQDGYCLFYFGGDDLDKGEKVFYKLLDTSSNSHGVYECQCLNTQKPLPWPERIYLTKQQLKTVQFIKSESDTAKSVFDHYSLYGFKMGFVFYFDIPQYHNQRVSAIEQKYDDKIMYRSERSSQRLVYIIDDVIESNRGDHVYQCTNIISNADNSFPARVYLTKRQFDQVNQLLGLGLLRKRAIYNDQQSELNKLKKLELEDAELDTEESQLKLLREEKLNWYFSIDYQGRTHQIVYYVAEIENVDKFVCKLSNKNGLDKFEADIPYPHMIVLNRDEIDDLEHNNHAFNGTGYTLNFDADIYSFYASFYMSRTHTQSWALFAVALFTYILQAASIYAIGWCFDVAYTEDVLKYYTIKAFEQCGVTAEEIPSNDTELFTESSFCVGLDPYFNETSLYSGNATNDTFVNNTFALFERDGATQEFVEPQSWWYRLGYVCTAFASLLILTFYIYKNSVGPIKLFVSLTYCDNLDKSARKKIIRIAVWTQIITLVAYGLGVWSIVMYPVGQGISDPFDVLALPISMVFVLELDDWVFHLVQIGYTAYIQTSFSVEITQNALADFGKRGWKLVQQFVYIQMLTCMFSLFFAMNASNNMDQSSDDVHDVFSNIIIAVFAFGIFLVFVFIWMSPNHSVKTKCIITICFVIYVCCVLVFASLDF
eukprot:529876_1